MTRKVDRWQGRQGVARFFSTAPEYLGAIAETEAARLVVSQTGKRYCVQTRSGGGYTPRCWRKSFSELRRHLPACLAAKVPVTLPDDPAAYPRPWAAARDQELAKSRDVSRTRMAADSYGGVIVRDGHKRAIWFQSKGRPPRYGAQVRVAWGWETYCATVSRAHLVAVLRGPDESRASDTLAQAMEAQPERASDYAGQRPERFDARHLRGSVRPPEARKSASREAGSRKVAKGGQTSRASALSANKAS